MIVTSPTHKWFSAATEKCVQSLVVASPYVSSYLEERIATLPAGVAVTLLTRTLLVDFASRASNLEAVLKIAQRSRGVLSLASLHAKVYVIDGVKALITSANATYSGMHRNRECGFQITDPVDVSKLDDLVKSGFGAFPHPRRWTVNDLVELRKPVEAIRAGLSTKTKDIKSNVDEPRAVELSKKQLSQVLDSFPAWTRLTFEGVSEIKSEIFTMDQVWSACYPLVLARFPNNRHAREKLRQQMQRLRDLGLVYFLGKGRYQRLGYVG